MDYETAKDIMGSIMIALSIMTIISIIFGGAPADNLEAAVDLLQEGINMIEG